MQSARSRKSSGIDRIALVYIDKMDIPEKKIEMKDYFKFYPQLGEELPHDSQQFHHRVRFPLQQKP